MVQISEPRSTRRLTLRRLELDDLDDLARIYGDPIVNRYLYWEPRDRGATLAALERAIARPVDVVDDNVLVVGAVDSASGRLVGDFILQWKNDEHRQGEIGGSLHPDVHGRGLAGEVYEELLRIGFDTYSLHRIIGRCDGRNVASIRALEKVGLRREALLIENEYVKGEWTDEVVLAIREGQWRARNRVERSGPPATNL